MKPPPLRRVGIWRSEDAPDLPDPRALAGGLGGAELREAVGRYLDSGAEARAFLGFSFCRFACGVPDEAMGSRELSDGEWLWPEGLSHYAREHGVRLPEAFVARMREFGWRAPDPGAGLEGRTVEDRTWREWARRAARAKGPPP